MYSIVFCSLSKFSGSAPVQWQKDNEQYELTNEEIKENIRDVILELKKAK